ncbi:MAG: TetR/AcrR family transcriptional regulator [Clostridiaceae bacterium]|nr:TetR/AcrR family transcriptional regulator [Clostridiaceae bacterium]
MTKIVDPRIRKTKRAIHDAFTSLLVEKDLNKITIIEIAERADINRKTFYNHYSGIHQLVDEVENELIETFNEALSKSDLSRAIKDPFYLYQLLDSILSNELNLRSHFKKFGFNSSLFPKILDALKISLMSVLSQKLELDKTTLKIAIEYWAAGQLAVLNLWYKDGSLESMDHIITTVGIISSSGLDGLLKTHS